MITLPAEAPVSRYADSVASIAWVLTTAAAKNGSSRANAEARVIVRYNSDGGRPPQAWLRHGIHA